MRSRFGWLAAVLLSVSVSGAADDVLPIPPEWRNRFPGIIDASEAETEPDFVSPASSDLREEWNEAGLTGEAEIAFVINAEGAVGAARVVSADFPELGNLGMEFIRSLEFTPAKVDGKPVPVMAQLTIPFGPTERPRVRVQPKPQYPDFMRRAGISGEVTVVFTVGLQGEVIGAYAERASHPGFRDAAISAVEKWKFTPGVRNGAPDEFSMRVSIPFIISDMPENTGWVIKKPKSFPDEFPEMLRWDKAPKLIHYSPPVYPRSALLDRTGGKVKVQFVVAPHGGVLVANAMDSSDDRLAGAAVAAVETFRFEPATRNGEPRGASLFMDFHFRVNGRGDVPVTDESRRLARLIRRDPDRIFPSGEIDAVPKLLVNKAPVIPSSHRQSAEDHTVRAEIVISRRGTVEMAKILEETDPAYGYAAVQALSEWQFSPPTLDGKVVDTRVVVPLIFRAQVPAD